MKKIWKDIWPIKKRFILPGTKNLPDKLSRPIINRGTVMYFVLYRFL